MASLVSKVIKGVYPGKFLTSADPITDMRSVICETKPSRIS
jgi:hypothetical protein